MSKKENYPEWVNDNNIELYKMRHTAEHILQIAVRELYPKALRAMGPPTKDGFYFDFEDKGGKIKEEDIPKLEKIMKDIQKKKLRIEKKEITVKEAKEIFKDNNYKLELIEEIKSKNSPLTIFEIGQKGDKYHDVDLCKGPHVENTKQIGYFKLMSIAGAYWRGDEKNKMLTRIYGTTFQTKKELADHLHFLEEVKKRDHRLIAKQMDLFFTSKLVGGGLNLWTPKGTIIRQELDDFVWELRKEKDYQKVTIPHITRKDLYVKSGHWDKFADELFKIKSREGGFFALKPMNCPHHTQIYNNSLRSYKDLPQRYAETTMVYRDEQSGEVSGLSRVRAITQDDAHVFCRENQIKSEINSVWDIISKFYTTLDLKLKVRLSFHDPDNFDKYLGTKDIWKKSESLLEELAKERGFDYFVAPGEAAMYGPKTDFMATDSLGREHQVATAQLDMNMPERFDLTCVNEQGEKERIVMLHVAIMGSIERFLGVAIEHFAGKFPAWLSPEQISIIPITKDQNAYANDIHQQLQSQNLRSNNNNSNQHMKIKIKDAQNMNVPYMLIVGEEEMRNKTVSLRYRNSRENHILSVQDFMEKVKENVRQREAHIELT